MSKDRMWLLLGILALVILCSCVAAIGGGLTTYFILGRREGESVSVVVTQVEDDRVPVDGLVAYYPFNGNANDESGNGNHGTEYGGLEYIDGVVGQAARFDGVDDFIDVPDSFFSEVTVSAIIRYDGGHVPRSDRGQRLASVVDGWEGRENIRLGIREENEQILFTAGFHDYEERNRCYHEIHVNSSSVVQSGEFYRIAMTYDGATLSLYVNGVLEGRARADKETWYSCTYRSEKPDIKIGFGGEYNTVWFNGLMDEVRIYERALSLREIHNLRE